jgi:formate-dependent nitrite reductase membrane component NrfD
MNSIKKPEFLYQTDWVRSRGIFLVIAFFLGGLGAALYLFSMYLEYFPGLVTGYLIVLVGKGSTHMIFLGKPWRFWRGLAKPQTSWISRGLIAIMLFLIPTTMQIFSSLPLFSWLPWDPFNPALQIFVLISAISLMIYTGFAISVVKAIRAWNSGMIPLMFIVYSFMGGLGLGLGMITGSGRGIDTLTLEQVAIGLMAGAIILWIIYLWTTYDSNSSGQQSVRELLKGRAAFSFFVGIVILGLLIPLTVTVISFVSGHVSAWVIVAASGCELIGGFSMRYSLLKAGVYAPLT